LAVTAQFGMPPDLNDEPLNRSPGTPSIYDGDASGSTAAVRNWVSGFRSVHRGGANFVLWTGPFRWVRDSIDAVNVPRPLDHAGGEVIPGDW